MIRNRQHIARFCHAASVLLIAATVSGQDAAERDPRAYVDVDRRDVFLGESIAVTILAEDVTKAGERVDVSAAEGNFLVRFVSSDTAMGGDESRAVYLYSFLPKRVGDLIIPPLLVGNGAETVATSPTVILTRAPKSSPDLGLTQSLSKAQCYVGEPVTLTVTWRVGIPLTNVKAVDLRVGALRNPKFDVLAPYPPIDPKDPTATGIPVSDSRIIARRGETKIGEKTFTTLIFSRTLMPRDSGRIEIGAATVFCAALPQNSRARRTWNQYPSYFDNDFFDQEVDSNHERLFAASGSLTIDVKPLPAHGRPPHFDGLVGACELSVEALPTTVSLGAPVTLTLRVSGHASPEVINMASLQEQPSLAGLFAVPLDRSLPKIVNGAMVYTQSIRPLRVGAQSIPPIELPYFDADTGAYAIAHSAPIPIVVSPGRYITGSDPDIVGDESKGQELVSLRDGLRHNVEGAALLENVDDPSRKAMALGLWALLLIGPPGVFAALAITRSVKRRREHPEAARSRNALATFRRRLGHASDWSAIDDAMRGYLADRLSMNARALTFEDAASLLSKHGVAPADLDILESLFAECEARRFASESPTAETAFETIATTESILVTIQSIEEALR